MRHFGLIAGLFLLPLIWNAARSDAGEIRGHVLAPASEAKAPPRYVVRGQKPNPAAHETSAGLVAVCLESLDSTPATTVTDTPFVMLQENTSFVPNLLAVPVGAKVTFPNRDAFFHNVFSYSPPRSFDLGRYPKGETRTVKFEEPGVVRIFCEIHASMYAAILVSPSDYYQVFEKTGTFSFADLPAGRYRVLALDAAGKKAMAELRLTDRQVQEVSLQLE